MPGQSGTWGLDIGNCALKAIRLANVDGVVTATAFDYVEHPKILSQPDADPDLLIREALEKFLSRNSLRGDMVAVGVPGQSGLARFVKLPPVEEKKISEIVKFEAKQQIPFPLEEVVWDFQKIGSGTVTDGFAMETEIGLFAIKRENISRSMQHFQDVGIEVDIIQMAPLALCNYVAYDLLKKEAVSTGGSDSGKKDCIVALDMGVESSNLVVTDGDRIIWQRPIPIGGNRFTRALTKDLKLTYAKAEHLKRNATKSPDLKRILLALRADLNEFVNEVQKSLAFFTNSQREAHIRYLIGMGNAFRLPGLQKYLNEKLQLEVHKLNKFTRLSGAEVVTSPVFNDNVMSMGVAYGLALQGLKQTRLHTNLLPQEIRTERLVRAKKPWAVTAAACLLVGIGGLTFGLRMEHDASAHPLIEEAKKKHGTTALRNAKDFNSKFNLTSAQIDDLKQLVRCVVAGQEERLNWLKLNKFVNECLPRPDGTNLNDKQKAALWDKEGGKDAFEKFAVRQAAARDDPAAAGDEGLDKLIQINLESVNALYCDKLEEYFNRLKEGNKALDGMPDADQKNPPSGGAWVVELRGYTYHEKLRDFVVDTLVDNLISRGASAAKPAAEPAAADPAAKKEAAAEAPDPVGGRVSHVILFRYKPVENPIADRFELIDNSDLFFLVTGTTKQPDGLGTAPTSPRSGWKPLGSERATFGPRDAAAPPPAAGAGDTPAPKRAAGQHIRTEFVVLFIWREPTPSDDAMSATGGRGGAPAAPPVPGQLPGGKAPPGKFGPMKK